MKANYLTPSSSSPSIAISSKLLLVTIAILIISSWLSFSNNNNTITDEDKFSSNEEYCRKLMITGAVGPESLAFDTLGGGPYTGVSDGRIIKWLPEEQRWMDFAVTSLNREGCGGPDDHEEKESICGRPLGLRFNEKTDDLYIADSYMGLVVVGPEGGLATQVTTVAEGVPLVFPNALDIDQRSGVVYFTDSSTRYQRRNYVPLLLSGDSTGRLIKYDPKSKETKVLLHNLTFPNGVSLSKDGDFLLVSETTNCRILKVWLENTKPKKVEVFSQLIGFPDNIERNEKGEYWIGMQLKKGVFLGLILSRPWIGKALVNLPFDITKVYSYISRGKEIGVSVRISENGEVLEVMENKKKNGWKSSSEIEERDGILYIGSVKMPFVAMIERKIQ